MLVCLSSLWQATKPTNVKAGHVGFQGGLLRSKSDRFLVSNQYQRSKVLRWGKGANAVNSEAIIRAAKLPTYLPTYPLEVGGGRWESCGAASGTCTASTVACSPCPCLVGCQPEGSRSR